VKDDMVNDGRERTGLIAVAAALAAFIVLFALYLPPVNHEFIQPACRRAMMWLRGESSVVAANGDTLTVRIIYLRAATDTCGAEIDSCGVSQWQ
jgi:hypothetical protein